MLRLTKHTMLVLAALGLSIGSAGFARRAQHGASAFAAEVAPPTLSPFALARLLADAPPDVVVIALDEPRHSLRFAMPAAVFGATDEALVENAPRLRRVVLVGFDVVRMDRLARRLRAAGRDVRVLAGGLDSWDKTMDQDPAAPPPGASAEAWQTYRDHVALRRSFGDAPAAPATPVAAPIAPLAAPAGAPTKKREGC